MLEEHQKFIKIADRLDFGWGVVAEYIADELVQDSDNEKHLLKAEKSVERKALKASAAPSSRSKFNTAIVLVQKQQPWATAHRFPSTPQSNLPSGLGAQRLIGPCFACGELGHLRADCPKSGHSKYPFDVCSEAEAGRFSASNDNEWADSLVLLESGR